jgi:putative redox protein
MVAAGLASCILTTMAMYGERHGIDLTGASATVEKHMTQAPLPRRIARLPVVVTMAAASVPAEMRERIEAVGHKCPVHASLHPEVDAPIEYRYV